jgi:hypothetical protein
MMSIYKIVDKTNNKIYVGQTSRNIYVRFSDHISRVNSKRKNDRNCRLYQAMIAHGKDNFTIELLEEFDGTISEADKKEMYWIEILNSTDPEIGYNMDKGGHNISENCRKARLAIQTGAPLSDSQLKAVRNNGAKIAKSICLYKLNGELIEEFPSIIEASRKMNCDRRSIQRALQGVYQISRIKQLNGEVCLWKYKQ